jgi:hypothetical protein
MMRLDRIINNKKWSEKLLSDHFLLGKFNESFQAKGDSSTFKYLPILKEIPFTISISFFQSIIDQFSSLVTKKLVYSLSLTKLLFQYQTATICLFLYNSVIRCTKSTQISININFYLNFRWYRNIMFIS